MKTSREDALDAIESAISRLVDQYCGGEFVEEWDIDGLLEDARTHFPTRITKDQLDESGDAQAHVGAAPRRRDRVVRGEGSSRSAIETLRDIERRVMLSVIDQHWREHLYEMDYLQEGINLRAMGQQDPLAEWQREGFDMFEAMMGQIEDDFVRYVFHLQVVVDEEPQTRHAQRAVQRAEDPVQGSSVDRGGDGRRGPEMALAAEPTTGAECVAADERARRSSSRCAVEKTPGPQRAVLLRERQEVQALPRALNAATSRRTWLISRASRSRARIGTCGIDDARTRLPSSRPQAQRAGAVGRSRSRPQGRRRVRRRCATTSSSSTISNGACRTCRRCSSSGATRDDESVEPEIAGRASTDCAATLDQLELRALFSGEHDERDAICEVHSGAGGTDSQDWAADAAAHVHALGASRRASTSRSTRSKRVRRPGITSATFIIKGRYAYGMLAGERGVHRLIRISPFDANARRQTAFASFDCVPALEATEEPEIDPSDLRIDTYRSSGAGGQHVNVTDSAVRITHLPTGVVVSCQNERSQTQNKAKAMQILAARLAERQREEHRKEIEALSGDKRDVAFGNQIRTYTLAPYQLVKDERTRFETGNVQAVLDGDLDAFIEAYLQWRRRG